MHGDMTGTGEDIGSCARCILSVEKTNEYFTATLPETLTFFLSPQIEQLKADIICLQDVQNFDDFFNPMFEERGYEGQITGGCATWYLKDVFTITDSHIVEFGNGKSALVTLLDKVSDKMDASPRSPNVGTLSSLMVVNAQLGVSGSPFVTLETHVRETADGLNLVEDSEGFVSVQPNLGLDSVDDDESSCGEEPVKEGSILSSINGSECLGERLEDIKTRLSGGRLSLEFLTFKDKEELADNMVTQETVDLFAGLDLVISEKLGFKIPPLILALSHGVKPNSPSYTYCANGYCEGSGASHSLQLKSAYSQTHETSSEAPYTVVTETQAATVDYIWHSDLLAIANTLDMVDKAALQSGGGLPNTDYSSQHVPLVATFMEAVGAAVTRTPLRDLNNTGTVTSNTEMPRILV